MNFFRFSKSASGLTSRRGSAMIGAIGIAVVGAAVVGGYLKMAYNEYTLSKRTLQLQSAMNLAEAGLEEAMIAINTKDVSGWSSVGSNGYYTTITDLSFTDTRTGPVKVYFEYNNKLPILVSEGRIINASGSEIVKQIRVDLKKSSLFGNALTAKQTIDFSGSPVSVDAYDSTVGDWDATTNRLDQATVASLSVNNGALDVGNGDIYGYVATSGGTPDVGPGGSIMGDGSTETMDMSRVSTSFYANLWDISVPTGTVDGVNYIVDYTSLAPGSIGSSGTSTNPEVYHITSFSMASSDQLNIVGPTVIIVDGDFSISGGAGINIIGVGSSLEMYAAGDVKIGGNGFLNDQLNPESFQLWGTAPSPTTQKISILGNGDTAGVIYAPNADLVIAGNGGMSGSAVAKKINIMGEVDFHYDINLKEFDKHSRFTVGRWRELRAATEVLDFTDMTALAASISPL